jgi:formamidopyrimidine-DNA glycosylase
MIEYPEAVTLARQISATLPGKTVEHVVVLQSPHKWAWFHGDPHGYPARLTGKIVDSAVAFGGMVELTMGDTSLAFYDGAVPRYAAGRADIPAKHQLLLQFGDGTALVGSVQMYGGFACFAAGTYDNRYYVAARQAPAPDGEGFSLAHFQSLANGVDPAKYTAKTFLATEQRVPGLGNGVLQDILWTTRVHPKLKMAALTQTEINALFAAVKRVLAAMTAQGGRDTERDLFGNPGGYKTILSKNTVGTPCPKCGTMIRKEPYLGGSIYVCTGCQRL